MLDMLYKKILRIRKRINERTMIVTGALILFLAIAL